MDGDEHCMCVCVCMSGIEWSHQSDNQQMKQMKLSKNIHKWMKDN